MSRKAIGAFGALAALLVFMGLPGATLASGSWGYTVTKSVCAFSGGANGYGKNVLSVDMWENGQSGVAQMNAHAIEQVYSGGTWQTVHDFGWSATKYFGDGPKSHTFSYGRSYAFKASDVGHRHRMVIRMIFGNGTAYPVARKKVVSPC
jgi:hypothetical protein